MVELLTWLVALGLFVQAAIGLSYLISSVWEKEKRASFFAAIQFAGMVGLLILFCLMFILPLVVVFVLVYFGTTSLQLGVFLKRHAALVKLATAVLFIAMAVWLAYSAVPGLLG